MAQNEEFLKVIAKNVTLHYPRLNQTHRYNTAQKRSEPCAQTASNAAWSITFEMSREEAKPLYDQLRSHYEACRSTNTKLPPFKAVFGMRKVKDEHGNETGMVQFTAKRNGVKKDGELNAPPMVIDGQKQTMQKLDLWSGSRGTVRAWAYATIDPDGVGGISLLLDAVQVVEARYGDNGLDDFDFYEDQGGEADPFDNSQKKGQQPAGGSAGAAPNQTSSAAEVDDEIPW